MGRLALTIILAALSTLPEGASAQEVAPHVRRAAVDAGFQFTTIRSEATTLGGGTVTLALTPRVSLGGGAWVMLGEQDLNATGVLFSMAYGGAVVDMELRRSGSVTLTQRLLVGAGNGHTSLRSVGTRQDADNFFVFEPRLGVAFAPVHAVAAAGSIGYRWVRGTDDLPGITDGHLGGFSFTLSLGLGRF